MVPRRLAAILLAITAASCAAYGGGEALGFALVTSCVRVRTPMERTFATVAEWQAFVATNGGTTSLPAEVSGRMIVSHFDGEGSACVGFSVESVREEEDAVVVRATRHTSPDPCIAVVAYPQLVLAVEARDRPVELRITDSRSRAQGQTTPCF